MQQQDRETENVKQDRTKIHMQKWVGMHLKK